MKLTPQQKQFVEQNHNLIYSFCKKYNLNVDEWYGVAAIALCKAAIRYDNKTYKFSTFAYIVMRNDVRIEMRKNRKNVYGFIDDMESELSNIEDTFNIEDDIYYKEFLDKYDKEHIMQLKLRGYTNSEIGQMIGRSRDYVGRKLKKIKKEIQRDREKTTRNT